MTRQSRSCYRLADCSAQPEVLYELFDNAAPPLGEGVELGLHNEGHYPTFEETIFVSTNIGVHRLDVSQPGPPTPWLAKATFAEVAAKELPPCLAPTMDG